MSIYLKEKDTHSNKATHLVEDDDDWETDPDFVNDVTEEEQRKGSRLINSEAMNVDNSLTMDQIREKAKQQDIENMNRNQNFSHGYGGKHGVMDNQDQTTA